MKLLLILNLSVIALTACGGPLSSDTSSLTGSWTGTFTGDENNTSTYFPSRLAIVQSDDELTGNYYVKRDNEEQESYIGPLGGNASESDVLITLSIDEDGDVYPVFKLEGRVNDDRVAGTFIETSSSEAGTFTLVRQKP